MSKLLYYGRMKQKTVGKLLKYFMKNNCNKCQEEFRIEKITKKKAINFMLTGNAIIIFLIDGQIKK